MSCTMMELWYWSRNGNKFRLVAFFPTKIFQTMMNSIFETSKSQLCLPEHSSGYVQHTYKVYDKLAIFKRKQNVIFKETTQTV